MVVVSGQEKSRLRQTVADMVRSLAVVFAVVAVIWLFTLRPQPDPVRVVDVAPTLALARAQAEFPVLYPDGLSSEWRPTSVRWQATDGSAPDPAFHVGFVTPDDAYVQIAESATTNPRYIPEQTSAGRPAGTDGQWQRYDNGQGTLSLVTVRDGVTIVVSGTADWAVLNDVAARLSPAR